MVGTYGSVRCIILSLFLYVWNFSQFWIILRVEFEQGDGTKGTKDLNELLLLLFAAFFPLPSLPFKRTASANVQKHEGGGILWGAGWVLPSWEKLSIIWQDDSANSPKTNKKNLNKSKKIGWKVTLLKFQGTLKLKIDIGRGKPLSF